MQATLKTLDTSTLQVMASTLESHLAHYADLQLDALQADARAQLCAITEELAQRTQVALTSLELAVLKGIDRNDFTDGVLRAQIWTNCLDQSIPADGPRGKALSGVVASLVKKGLVGVDNSSTSKRDHTLWITEAGAKLYIETVGLDNVTSRR